MAQNATIGVYHIVNSANNSDVLVPFLVAYRATPNTTTKYSPFYLLHGREMPLPTCEDLKAKISKEIPSHSHRLENFKASLRSAYKLVRGANGDIIKTRSIMIAKSNFEKAEVNDLVYLYKPAIKPGWPKTFCKKWTGPYKVVTKLSDLNYQIVDQQNKTLVHVNRLKPNNKNLENQIKTKGTNKLPKKPTSYQEEKDEHYL